MAPRGKPFVKGQSGNPAGRPPIPPEVKAARKLNQDDVEVCLTRIIRMDDAERAAIIADPKTSGMDKLVAKIVEEGVSKGDQFRLDFLFNRLIGKVKEQVDVSASDGFKIIVEDYTGK